MLSRRAATIPNLPIDARLPVKPLTSQAAGPLVGTAAAPGDKSISHRALMLGALAVGETRIEGILDGEDVRATAAALRAMGAQIAANGDGAWILAGRGVAGLAEPETVIDMGNSGTGARLMMGVAAGHPHRTFLAGDTSLSRRPMDRVIAPLAAMGARIESRGGRLPLMVEGAADPLPLDYVLPVASAQVKSAVLLAGLAAPGRTSVIEPEPTRDHTERMLRHFGAEVIVEDGAAGRRATLTGQPELEGRTLTVPADPSSAAFPAVAALIVPDSEIVLPGVGTNPHRTGLYQTLVEMGADLTFESEREQGGEPVADLRAAASALRGIEVPASRAPAMIDEYPVLAVAAACATGTTVMHGLAELRVKESDRLAAMAAGLALCGVEAEAGDDWLAVHGCGGPVPGPGAGARIETHMDHRIAMAFLILGLAAERPMTVDDGAMIATSFPGFTDLMAGLGARIGEAEA